MMDSKYILMAQYPSWCGTENTGESGAVLGLGHGSTSRPPLHSHYTAPTPMIHDGGVAVAKWWLCVEIPHYGFLRASLIINYSQAFSEKV